VTAARTGATVAACSSARRPPGSVPGPARRVLPCAARGALAVTLLFGMCPSAPAQFVAPEGSRYHNGASLALQDEGDGADALTALRTALADGASSSVVVLFSGLRADRREQLVSLGPRVDAPAIEVAARRLLASGDREGHRAVLAEARTALAAARAARDLPVLLDHATRGIALETSREAALAAARLFFEEGRWWEAASLATRAGALPGAAALQAAARRRLSEGVPAVDGAPTSARWVLQRGAALTIDDNPSGGLPLVTDGRRGELLFLDARGLFPIDRVTAELTLKPFEVLPRLLGDDGLDLPGVARHALAREGDRFFLPVNALRIPRFADRGEFKRSPTVSRAARLAALDLGPSEIVSAWTVLPAPPPADPRVSTSLGPPLAVGRRVFCLVFRVALTTDVSLLAVSADDGRTLFEIPLVNAAQIRRYASRTADTSSMDLDKTADESALAERDGIVYACTGHGVFAAVDGLTGHVRHTFRYDRTVSQDPDTYDPAFLFDTGCWRDEPVRLWPEAPPAARGPVPAGVLPAVGAPEEAGPASGERERIAPEAGPGPGPERVVIAPGDSRFIYMLAREPGPAGQLIVDDPIERLDRLDIAGLVSDPHGRVSPALICTWARAGRGGAMLVGPDGHVLQRGLMPLASPDDDRAQITGRPLLVGSRVLVPSTVGVVNFESAQLSAPTDLLPRDPASPAAAAAVFAVRDGLATLSPQLPRAGKRGYWYLQWYASAP